MTDAVRQALAHVLKDGEQICNCGWGIAVPVPCTIFHVGRPPEPSTTFGCQYGCATTKVKAMQRLAETYLALVSHGDD